ncbi:patatin-like phospholipase family protein [Noviherbaspirillum sp. CPCC 100848]|uniref:Patatin-like phospholipase family protein n=1 Tax=Noviherbaspirillum album TaxID=3080276 RepID=A0ABU6J5B6_9BURK|nr:patatin-like phospholipase family protein [Noviherbaspirillum sp. CPCC 100848]MEC4718832.1 patatin-like phospholipase family protein [Noviherbaspirillum sp. CPCC 100848]
MTATVKPIAARPRIALVLQGGGALGAYQAGVFQAMDEHGLTPDWVIGTSIGAINAALIAGNRGSQRVTRLRQFWDEVAQNDLLDMRRVPDPVRQFNIMFNTMSALTQGVQGFYSPRWCNPFAAGWPVAPEAASFFDTAPLEKTLAGLVDFDCINGIGGGSGIRLTVSAIRVDCGQLDNFDSASRRMTLKHILASGALPPGFPPVRIDGHLYWDGGLYSNTPLETLLADEPRIDTTCFMVDLWSADGPEPKTLEQVQTRQKDVMFASRSQRHIDAYLRGHKLRRMVRMLRDKLPSDALSDEERRQIDAVGADSTVHIVRLAYAGRDWQMASKDINFSRGSIEWRWEQGYRDALRAIGEGAWRQQSPEGAGILVHDIPPADAQEEAQRPGADAARA